MARGGGQALRAAARGLPLFWTQRGHLGRAGWVALGLGLGSAPALAAPSAPTAYLGVDEARVLPEHGHIVSLGLVPTVGVGHAVNLGLAQALGPGELRAHALLAGRAQAVEGAMGGLGYKLPLGHWGPWTAAALAEFSAGQSAMVATPRMLLGSVALPCSLPLGAGGALTLTPRLGLRDDGLTTAPSGALASAGLGLSAGLRWPLGLGLSALGEAGALWAGRPVPGPWPAPVLRLGLRWAPSAAFTWDLGVGFDPSSGLGTPLGRPEQAGLLNSSLSWGW